MDTQNIIAMMAAHMQEQEQGGAISAAFNYASFADEELTRALHSKQADDMREAASTSLPQDILDALKFWGPTVAADYLNAAAFFYAEKTDLYNPWMTAVLMLDDPGLSLQDAQEKMQTMDLFKRRNMQMFVSTSFRNALATTLKTHPLMPEALPSADADDPRLLIALTQASLNIHDSYDDHFATPFRFFNAALDEYDGAGGNLAQMQELKLAGYLAVASKALPGNHDLFNTMKNRETDLHSALQSLIDIFSGESSMQQDVDRLTAMQGRLDAYGTRHALFHDPVPYALEIYDAKLRHRFGEARMMPKSQNHVSFFDITEHERYKYDLDRLPALKDGP